MPDNRSVTILFAVGWLVKVIILVLESKEKRSLLKKPYEGCSLESTASTFNRTLFWWLNGLLWKGFKTTLTVDSLPELDDALKTASNPEELIEKWNKGNLLPRADKRFIHSGLTFILADKYRPNALLWTLASHYMWDIMEGVLPRLAFLGLSFAQPFLVERVLGFMTEPEHINSTNYARGLVAAYALVYIGLAVCGAIDLHVCKVTDILHPGIYRHHSPCTSTKHAV